jgi:thiol-disulfide isomerase/thioredoxin
MKSVYLILATLLLFTNCTQQKKNLAGSPSVQSPAEETSIEDPLAGTNLKDNIKLFDLDDQPIDLNQFAGKKVFLNFWATWCKPCIAEMPSIERAQELLEPEGYIFMLASDEDVSKIKRFKASKDFQLNFVRLETPFPDLGVMSIPTTLIIDEQGKISMQHVGAREWDSPEVLDQMRSNSM